MSDEKEALRKRHDEALAAYERSRRFYIEYVLDGFPPPPVVPANLEDVHDIENWRVAWNVWVNLDGIQERRHPLSEISREELPRVVAKEKALRRDVLAYRSQQEYERVLHEIRKMEEGWRASDPDYKKKNSVLHPILKPILRTLPTSQWKEVIELAYRNTPVATIAPPVDQEALERKKQAQEELWRKGDEELRKLKARTEARERLWDRVGGRDYISLLRKKEYAEKWLTWSGLGCFLLLYGLIALLVLIASHVASTFFSNGYSLSKVYGAIAAALILSPIVHMIVSSAWTAIMWRLGHRKARFEQLLRWMVHHDMPPRSEALLWATGHFVHEIQSDPNIVERATVGYYYIYWLSHDRFGNPDQKRTAKEYIAAYEKMGWFEQKREWNVLRDATTRYFALMDECMLDEKTSQQA